MPVLVQPNTSSPSFLADPHLRCSPQYHYARLVSYGSQATFWLPATSWCRLDSWQALLKVSRTACAPRLVLFCHVGLRCRLPVSSSAQAPMVVGLTFNCIFQISFPTQQSQSRHQILHYPQHPSCLRCSVKRTFPGCIFSRNHLSTSAHRYCVLRAVLDVVSQ